MNERLMAIGTATGGVLCIRDLERVEVSEREVALLVRRGTLVRLMRGVYVLGDPWRRARDEHRFRVRVRAVLRALRQDGQSWQPSHHAHLVLRDLPLWNLDCDVVDVEGPCARSRISACIHRHPPAGLAGPGLAVALVQTFLRDGAIAAAVPGDAALHRGLITSEDLRTVRDGLVSTRSRARVERWIGALDKHAESVGETRTRFLLGDLGYQWRSQVEVPALGARVDFLIGEWLVVEFDGKMKYDGDQGARVVFEEKRREERLGDLGFIFVRLSWQDLSDPATVHARLVTALAEARRRHGTALNPHIAPRSTAA